MGLLLYLLILQAKQTFSYSLEYDPASHQYEDLLISISPDIPGGHSFSWIHWSLIFSDTKRDETIQNIKDWITQVSCWNLILLKTNFCREAPHYTLQVRDGLSSIRYEEEKLERWLIMFFLFSIQVYILVPSSWALIDGSEEAHQVHEDAEIRVELTNNLYGDTPFTLQTGECGKQGEYIQVHC